MLYYFNAPKISTHLIKTDMGSEMASPREKDEHENNLAFCN